MTHEELEQLYLYTEHGTFTPNYTYTDFILNEETQEYEYIGLVIHKSAQEVYDEWLENKDKPQEPPVDQMEILKAKVDGLEVENKEQTTNISTNSDMIFMTMDATTELNEGNIQNTQLVLISMDALTEINEQLIALQEEINKLKGGVA